MAAQLQPVNQSLLKTLQFYNVKKMFEQIGLDSELYESQILLIRPIFVILSL